MSVRWYIEHRIQECVLHVHPIGTRMRKILKFFEFRREKKNYSNYEKSSANRIALKATEYS